MPEIDGRLDALKKNLDGLSQRYTDQHPDVIGIKRQIKELEEQKAQVLAARKKAAVGDRAEGRRRLSGQSRSTSSCGCRSPKPKRPSPQLRTRVAEYEARFAKLKDSAKLAPQMEAEYTQLNRDYGVHKRNYETLVSRREQAEISGDMENVSGADFRLIDPPRVSPQPVAPNRMLLLLAAFVAALGGRALRELRREPDLADVLRCPLAPRDDAASRAGRGDDDRRRRPEAPRAPRPDRLHRRRPRLPRLLWRRPARDFPAVDAHRLSERP